MGCRTYHMTQDLPATCRKPHAGTYVPYPYPRDEVRREGVNAVCARRAALAAGNVFSNFSGCLHVSSILVLDLRRGLES